MVLKKNLKTKLIYEAVYKLCMRANTKLPKTVYEKLASCTICQDKKNQILQNAYLAFKKNRPLCQDTGQVVIFINIGQDVSLVGEYLNDEINKAVSDCWKNNFYRNSVVKDALFDRKNTNSNTPCIIHTQLVRGNEVEILLGLKGGGAENTSRLKMFNPTASEEEIFDFIKETAELAGENACPPMSLGIGIGGTVDYACLLAKKALFTGNPVNIKLDNVFETKMLSAQTHIACLPVCVNVNCHSSRYAKCRISDGKIIYEPNDYTPVSVNFSCKAKKVKTDDIETLKALRHGEKIYLSGIVYTARDAAHKKLTEIISDNETLPIDLNNAVIFYAGPCPKTPYEVIGPIGPTTSKRMDKFAPQLYDLGVLATIGKGERTFKKDGALYFKLTGGVASLIQNCIKNCKIAAFEELGPEAVYKLEVENLPLETCLL